jgi:hypothetical protein
MSMSICELETLFAHEQVTVYLRRRARYAGHVARGGSPEARYARQLASSFGTRNPTRPGETPSRRTAVMGCPRSVRPPLGLRRSKLSNTKNVDEREAETRAGKVYRLVFCDYVLLFNRPSPLMYIRGGWTSRARRRLGVTSKTLVRVELGWVGPNFPKLSGQKLSYILRGCFEAVNDLKSKFRNEQSCSSKKMKNFHV